MPELAVPPNTRLIFLDWIRILAFAVLVLFHVGMYYVSWDWHIKSPNTLTGLETWMRLTSPWRMDLLFLVSGAATAFMLASSGATRAFMKSRASRLGLPLLLGMVLIVPPQSWLEVRDKLGYAGNFAEFMGLYLQGYGGFCFAPGRCLMLPTWNHLWFLPYLLVYTGLLWLALRAWPGMIDRAARVFDKRFSGFGMLLWPVVLLALLRGWLQPLFPDTRALIDDWAGHSHFVTMFLAGVLFSRSPRVWSGLAQLRWWALLLALSAWLAMAAGRHWLAPGSELMPRAVWVALYCTQQWCAIVAVLGFGYRHLNQDNALRRYLTVAVFPVYILHQSLIILLAKAMLPLQWEPLPEAAALVVGTLLVSLCVFECVRRVSWLGPWFGVQHGLKPTAGATRLPSTRRPEKTIRSSVPAASHHARFRKS